MNMKKLKCIGAVILAVITLTGCGKYESPTSTFFPTNHWIVRSAVEGEVVVEAEGTDLKLEFRVLRATPVAPLTNGQSARVEVTVRHKPYGRAEFISARAYPSVE